MLELGFYAEVFEIYEKYRTSNPEISDLFSDHINKIEKIKEGNSAVELRIALPKQGKAMISLLKNSFVIEPISGRIDSFLLRCDSQFARFQYKADMQYDLPASTWGRC